MNTPIVDFVKKYSEKNATRLHMPGHKGKAFLGIEHLDITEIDGADVLYSGNGIIAESENNASRLFGTGKTLYSCQGTSLSIRAMLYLAVLYGNGSRKILALRNAHKVFMTAVTLLDMEVEWLCNEGDGIISCDISPKQLDERLSSADEPFVAFYCTSPDYLGNLADIKGYAEVCRKHGVLLLCDNAHGAYLNFLPESLHPIALGAHMCCDSAHKTLPVLTGGGYLHISCDAPSVLSENAERAMAMFASTSPSYLILQSLDMANKYLAQGYRERLSECIGRVDRLKDALVKAGFVVLGDERLKLTIAPKAYGYTGSFLAEYLLDRNIVCEFADSDYTVFMFTPETEEEDFKLLEKAVTELPRMTSLSATAPAQHLPRRAISPREAAFSPSIEISVDEAEGRILACECVSCPPAIPVAVCGEIIDQRIVELFKYIGISKIRVIKNS